MSVEWREIPGFWPYLASSDGHIGRRFKNSFHVLKDWAFQANSRTYRKVDIGGKGRKQRGQFVHRLVLLAFKGPTLAKDSACHLNDDGEDNRITNLKWASAGVNEGHKTYPPCICGREMAEHSEDGQAMTPGPDCRSGYQSAREARTSRV